MLYPRVYVYIVSIERCVTSYRPALPAFLVIHFELSHQCSAFPAFPSHRVSYYTCTGMGYTIKLYIQANSSNVDVLSVLYMMGEEEREREKCSCMRSIQIQGGRVGASASILTVGAWGRVCTLNPSVYIYLQSSSYPHV